MDDRKMWEHVLETFRCVVGAHRKMPGLAIGDVMGNTTPAALEAELRFLDRQAQAAPALLAALQAVKEDYRTEGCADPECITCRRSQAAAAIMDAAIAQAKGGA